MSALLKRHRGGTYFSKCSVPWAEFQKHRDATQTWVDALTDTGQLKGRLKPQLELKEMSIFSLPGCESCVPGWRSHAEPYLRVVTSARDSAINSQPLANKKASVLVVDVAL